MFVHWMREARAVCDRVPQVTAATLAEVSYAFFLDGVDEVAPELRPGVIAALHELALRWPHHRWLVAARRVPELDGGALAGFAEYELVPSREWLVDFAAQRGVTVEQVDAFADAAPGLSDLIQIPLYAAAAVQAVIEGRPPPASPLALLLDFASQGLREEETRARADLADIERWLDRLCLAMLAADVDDVEAHEAAFAPLRGAVDHDVTVNWLVTRVLLREQSGRVRPIVRPLRDARAARALAEHPRAEELFSELAVAVVAGERHLRPQWQYVVDLLLGSDLPRWRSLVEPVDPLSVARAVPPTSPASDRHAAVTTIWAWYRHHRLHIPRTREGQLLDDLEALVALAHDGLPDQLRAEVATALNADDMTVRGNAVAILARVEGGQHVSSRLFHMLDDPAPVVRRRVAEAVAHLGLSRYATPLVDKAINDPDELARRTLASIALEVADDTELEGILTRLPERLRAEVQLTIDRRWSRDRQLRFLLGMAQPPPDWLEHLARWTDDPWTEDEVERLAEAWVRSDPTRTDEHIRTALLSHPKEAIRGSFRVPLDETDLFDIAFLLDSLSEEQLADLPTDAPGPAALVRRYTEWRSAPPSMPERTRRPMARPPSALDALIDAGDLEAILASRPGQLEVDTLTGPHRSALLELVQAAWADDDGSTPISRVNMVGERHWNATVRDWRLLDIASELRMPLNEDDWYRLADLGLAGHDNWLDDAFVDDWAKEIEARIDPRGEPGLQAMARSVPLTAEAAERMADRCLGSENEELRRVFADRLATLGHAGVLRARVTTLPSTELDVALVRAGDEAAEHRLLTDFVRRGCPAIERWGGDGTWIEEVRHKANGPLILECLTFMLRRGDEPHELTALFRGLIRCMGAESLAAYDSLMADAGIPDAPFLWYRREEAIVQLSARPEVGVADIAARLFAQ